jgi:hypothetical protein
MYINDHHSPLTLEHYIEYLLLPVTEIYKYRLPTYTRPRNFLSVMLRIVASVGTILAYKQFSSYVLIIATVAAAITSWMEFNNITTKISHCNITGSSLESLAVWWSSLPEVEKNMITNIDDLVKKGKEVIVSNSL